MNKKYIKENKALLREFLGGRVSLETMIILDELVSYGTFKSDEWNKEMGEDIIWIDLRNLMDNYERFLTIDVKKYRIRLLKLIEESK